MLRALLQVAAVRALLTLCVGTAVLAWDTHRIALDADRAVRDLDEGIKTQTVDLAQDEMHLDLVLNQVNDAASEQRAYWQKTSVDSDKTVKALRLLVDRASLLLDHSDQQLNGLLLPDADRQLNLTAEATQGTFSSLDHASSALAFQLNDLDLGPTMANLSESSARLADTMAYLQQASGHADNILASGERTTLYYEKKLTTPASFARKLSDFILQSGSEARILFVGH